MKILQKVRTARYISNRRKSLKKEIVKAHQNNGVKLQIGSGKNNYNTWVNLDLPFLDIRYSQSWKKLLGELKIDAVLAEHVFEHLTKEEVLTALAIMKEYLNPAATVRVAVPDKLHPNPEYIDYVKPGGLGAGADDHKSFWSFVDFQKIGEQLQYAVKPIEYYDEKGQLHMNPLNEENGPIKRSARNDLNHQIPDYSSLIVDFVKPSLPA